MARGKKIDLDVSTLSQWQLIVRRFKRHRLAHGALMIVLAFYTLALFADFFTVNEPNEKNAEFAYCPPRLPRFNLEHGLHYYPARQIVDPVTLKREYVEDRDNPVKLGFFVRGYPYKLWGLIPMQRHLIGVRETRAKVEGEGLRDGQRAVVGDRLLLSGDRNDVLTLANRGSQVMSPATGTETTNQEPRTKNEEPMAASTLDPSTCNLLPPFHLFGADKFGRDIYSRLVVGSRISLFIGMVAIAVSFVLGIVIGGISGYFGGAVDNFIQRSIEIINSFPKLPLWMALGAALPRTWSNLQVFFGITIILSLMGWTSLARVVRGKLLVLREEDYAVAARLLGASHSRIIFRHLVPGFTSHIIVSLTMTIPAMILGETALSFLGLGLKPPVISWGVMLQDCMSMQVVKNYPWLLMPVVFIVLAVLCFNFFGDGMRDAADPYHSS